MRSHGAAAWRKRVNSSHVADATSATSQGLSECLFLRVAGGYGPFETASRQAASGFDASAAVEVP